MLPTPADRPTGSGWYHVRMEGRILIIDDDAGVRRVLERILEGAGYEVERDMIVAALELGEGRRGEGQATGDVVGGLRYVLYQDNYPPLPIEDLHLGLGRDAVRLVEGGADGGGLGGEELAVHRGSSTTCGACPG